jgi:hypothetical protein
VGFPSLLPYDFNDKASSLGVTGTVTLYGDVNYGNGSITFTDQNVADLTAQGWNDRASSLVVDGTVTLYQHVNYDGKKVTFTSNSLPYENIGTEWNENPNLTKNEGAWDCRTWHWDTSRLEIYHGDSENYVKWESDGLVQSRAKDGLNDPYKVSNFDQGYERYENEIYNLSDWGWDNKASSLRVEGSIDHNL